MKIDVEGAERLVLEGAVRALGEHRIDILQIECNEMSIECLGEIREPIATLLREHGYALCRPTGSGEWIPLTEAGFGPDIFGCPNARIARVPLASG